MIKIRKANKKDLNDIEKLSLEYSEYENGLDDGIILKNFSEIKNNEEKWIALGTEYLIAENMGEVVGFLSFTIDKSGKENIGNIHTTIIKNGRRGQGIGKRLFNYAKQIFKRGDCRRIKTFIHKKNKGAFKFWKKQGFEMEEGFLGTIKLK